MAKVINKSLTAVIFGSYPNLLCKGADLGEEMAEISFNGESSTRIRGAFESIISPEFFVQASISINILKTSNLCAQFLEQYKNSTILDGTALFSFENGEIIKLKNLTFEISSISGSGKDVVMQVTINGDVDVNQNLL